MWKLSINQPGETKSRGRSLLYAKLADFLGKKKKPYISLNTSEANLEMLKL